jgi:hypothetical protein
MLTGVLCSSNCAVEAVCQLFLLLLHAQGLQNVHTAWYTLRLLLGRPGTRESAGNHPTTNLLSLNCSVAAPPARCVQVTRCMYRVCEPCQHSQAARCVRPN